MPRRAMQDVEEIERRDERSPADQATGGVLHPNGTHIVSADHDFLASCVRLIVADLRAEAA